MLRGMVFNVAALVALAPAALLHLRSRGGRDVVFWAVLGVATAGALSWAITLLAEGWHTGLSAALWVSISTSLVVFVVLAAVSAQAWCLTPLLLPYLLLLGVVATVWTQAPEQPLSGAASSAWLGVHIAVSVLTYALLTIAAVAGLAVLLQEGALKRKRTGGDWAGSYRAEWHHFLDCAETGKTPEFGLAEGRRALTVGLAAMASLAENRPVRIADAPREIIPYKG